MASGGPDAITLRAIAREMGMTANAIYGYFPTRDDLVTTLINDVYTALADAVDTAWEATPSAEPAVRIEAWANAFRTWALVNPQGFRLIYGDPVPGYQAPEGAPPPMPHTGSAPGSPPSRQPPGPTPSTSTRAAPSTGPTSTPGS
ncbi:TetR family transcriptional regulator [Streptomyces sp. N2A]|uniref:TetR/AcrR family transcriptional regulator n=1 Tax=Streptomyces sp. N2A TaxID=3073936 RepID=UPI0037DA58A7